MNFLRNSSLVSNHESGIVGLSIRGGAAIDTASLDHQVKGLITVGAISHPFELMKYEFQKRKIPSRILRLLFGYMQVRFGIDFDKTAPINNIRNAEADILLIHGDKDTTVSLEQGQALEKFENKNKVQFWIVPDKGHSDCETHPEVWGKVEGFLNKSLPIS